MKGLFSHLPFAVAICIGLLPGSSFGNEIDIRKIIPSDTSNMIMLESMTGSVGSYLTDDQGISLYMFEADTLNMSNCYDTCAQAWPPVLVSDEQAVVSATGNVLGSLIGKVMRSDGSFQVTYNGMPLYYFLKDKNPGDITGQGIYDFGALWYLVRPEGTKIN